MSEGSKPCLEGAFSATVDFANHVCEVIHAQVQAASVAEKAFVELLLVILRVLRRIADYGSVLLFGVATPHAVNGFLAGKEVVTVLGQLLGVTDLHTDLVKFALSVSVTQKSDFFSARNDGLYVQAELMLAILLLAVVERV